MIQLAFTLPVSIASTERTFSALKIVKNRLRNKMREDYLANALGLYIVKDHAQNLSLDSISERLSAMSNRRSQFKLNLSVPNNIFVICCVVVKKYYLRRTKSAC